MQTNQTTRLQDTSPATHNPAAGRRWTATGEQLFDAARATREGHCHAAGLAAVATAIDGLTWHDVTDTGLELPFSPGQALEHLIRELSLPGVPRVAWNGAVPVRDDAEHTTGAYGLYGIEFTDAGQCVRLYAVDRGVDLLVMATDTRPATPGRPVGAEQAGK